MTEFCSEIGVFRAANGKNLISILKLHRKIIGRPQKKHGFRLADTAVLPKTYIRKGVSS